MPDALTNVRAPLVVRARRLLQGKFRQQEGQFLAEGPQACREAARYAVVRTLFATPAAAARYDDITAAVTLRGGDVVLCDERVIESLCEAVSPQGMVAAVEYPVHPVSAALHAGSRLVVVLASVRDPGNAGAVVRAADAVGADGVIVTAQSVDMGNPKVVRSSAGSLFHVPVIEGADLHEVIAGARAAGMQVLAADGSGEPLGQGTDLAAPTMWVFGNEAWGLPTDVMTACDRVVALPIYGKAESLNLATAAAVCLYASAGAQHASQ